MKPYLNVLTAHTFIAKAFARASLYLQGGWPGGEERNRGKRETEKVGRKRWEERKGGMEVRNVFALLSPPKKVGNLYLSSL